MKGRQRQHSRPESKKQAMMREGSKQGSRLKTTIEVVSKPFALTRTFRNSKCLITSLTDNSVALCHRNCVDETKHDCRETCERGPRIAFQFATGRRIQQFGKVCVCSTEGRFIGNTFRFMCTKSAFVKSTSNSGPSPDVQSSFQSRRFLNREVCPVQVTTFQVVITVGC